MPVALPVWSGFRIDHGFDQCRPRQTQGSLNGDLDLVRLVHGKGDHHFTVPRIIDIERFLES
jgi:hypothetical protein